MIFLHVTKQCSVESILREGLRPGSYLIEEQSRALVRYYVETIHDEDCDAVVLRIDGDMLDLDALEPDYPGIEEPISGVLGCTDEQVWTDWRNTAQMWQDSVEVVGSCRSAKLICQEAIQVQAVIERARPPG